MMNDNWVINVITPETKSDDRNCGVSPPGTAFHKRNCEHSVSQKELRTAEMRKKLRRRTQRLTKEIGLNVHLTTSHKRHLSELASHKRNSSSQRLTREIGRTQRLTNELLSFLFREHRVATVTSSQVKSSQVQISMAAAPAAFGGEIGRARRGATGMAGEP